MIVQGGEQREAPVGKSVSLVWQPRSGVGETGVKGAGTMASDAGGGKSSMILSLTTKTFKDFHSPTEFENYTAKVDDAQQSYLLR